MLGSPQIKDHPACIPFRLACTMCYTSKHRLQKSNALTCRIVEALPKKKCNHASSIQLQLCPQQLCKLFRPAPGHHPPPLACHSCCSRHCTACSSTPCRCLVGRRLTVAAAAAAPACTPTAAAAGAAASCFRAQHDPQRAGEAIWVGLSSKHAVASAATGGGRSVSAAAWRWHRCGAALGGTCVSRSAADSCCLCCSVCRCCACHMPVPAAMQQQDGWAVVSLAVALKE